MNFESLEEIIRRAAPELAVWPVYIVGPASMARWFGAWAEKGCKGFTERHLAIVLRPQLEREGSWKGNGPAFFIDHGKALADVLLKREASGWPPPGPEHLPHVERAALVAVALHELAHCLLWPWTWAAEDTPADIERSRAVLAAWVPRVERGAPSHPGQLDMHGPRFLRMLAHLAHRCPERPRLLDAWTPGLYGVDHAEALVAALEDDARDLEGLHLEKVATAPLPRPVESAWAEVLARTDEDRRTLSALRCRGATEPAPDTEKTDALASV